MCISKFVNLAILELCRCKNLRVILELPLNIKCISVVDCISLEVFSLLSKILEHKDIYHIRKMDLSNCSRLCDNLGLDVGKMANLLVNQVGNSWFETLFPGNEVPKWFNCRKDVCVPVGGSETDQVLCELVVEIPHSLKWEDTGMVLCVVSESTEEFVGDCCFLRDKFTINGHSLGLSSLDVCYASREAESPHVWLKYTSLPGFLRPKLDRQSPSMPYMCQIILRRMGTGLRIKSCGVHLAYVSHGGDGDKLENEDDEEFYSCHSADATDDADAEEVNSDCFHDQRTSDNDAAKKLIGDTRLGLRNPKKRTWADYIDGKFSGSAAPSDTVPKK
ncbi:hypothetical protein RchiOBHm_Chr6g0265601 [Rosa chinensis]|uniref:Uncharacterized protein n=1 Tax=Rosa chinensis TaxID=74649 RepID=A0A2P6PPG0_ROSCH|nr:hypothetical protein RchiOBHm_Chr6g0265601 [Rosa chinensis]